MNKHLKFCNLILALLSASCCFTLDATDYYVSNEGNDNYIGTSESTPWASLSKLSTVTFSPGDRILLRCGDTWNESLILNGSGSASNPITLTEYIPTANPSITQKPKIIPDASGTPPSNPYAILLEDISYWKIERLEISGANSGIVWIHTGLDASGNNNYRHKGLEIRDCYIHDCFGKALKDQNGYPVYHSSGWETYHDAGILATRMEGKSYPSGGIGLEDLLIIDTIADNCSTPFRIFWVNDTKIRSSRFLKSREDGGYFKDSEKITVSDSLFSEMGNERDNIWGITGLTLFACDEGLIEYNEFRETKVIYYENENDDWEGIDAVGIDLEADNTNITIRNNYFHHNEGAGILIYENENWGTGKTDNIEICENIFSDNGRKYLEASLSQSEQGKPHPNDIHYAPAPNFFSVLNLKYVYNVSYIRNNPSVDGSGTANSAYMLDDGSYSNSLTTNDTLTTRDLINNSNNGINWFDGSEWPSEEYFIWNFDELGNTEGFEPENHISSFGISNEALSGTASGYDPYFRSTNSTSLDIDQAYDNGDPMFQWIEFAMNHDSDASLASVGFNRTGESWNSNRMKWFSIRDSNPSDSNFTVYRINMGSNQYWDGILSQIRIDPLDTYPLNPNGSFYIDYIRIAPDFKLYMWEFDGKNDYEKWENGAYSNISWLDYGFGYLTGDVNGADPYVVTPNNRNLNIDASSIDSIQIRIRNSTEADEGTFWFKKKTPTGQSQWYTATDQDNWFSLTPNSDTFEIIAINTSDLDNWDGIIEQIRIDPCDLVGKSPKGKFFIDYVELIPK